ncbi:hypothetical protein GmHk_13G036671 [Glycine max]|nr:hypothetical protein GmHk_13G036671 [Glycine max]
MDSQNMSYNAGQAKGQAQFLHVLDDIENSRTSIFVLLQEKAGNMMDKASSAAQSAQNSMQQAGQQMQAKAQGAADAVKNATGMNN